MAKHIDIRLNSSLYTSLTFLFPSKNKHCQSGIDSYNQYLAFDNEFQNCFYPMYLDDFINTLTKVTDADWPKELKQRYIGMED